MGGRTTSFPRRSGKPCWPPSTNAAPWGWNAILPSISSIDMADSLRKLTDSWPFHALIILLIVAAGVLVGLETYPDIVSRHGGLLHLLDRIILWVFVVEI